jgi:hypothetical protein
MDSSYSHGNECLGSIKMFVGRLCGLVARVLGYRFGVPVSIPGNTKKK